MNKFQNDKRKALNREYARFYYLLQKFNHIAFKISQVRSPKRAIKLSYQLVLTHTKIIVVRAQIITIQLQPIPRFPSGGVVHPQIGFEQIRIHKDSTRKPESVITINHGGRSTGKIWAEKMNGEFLAEAIRNFKPKTDNG